MLAHPQLVLEERTLHGLVFATLLGTGGPGCDSAGLVCLGADIDVESTVVEVGADGSQDQLVAARERHGLDDVRAEGCKAHSAVRGGGEGEEEEWKRERESGRRAKGKGKEGTRQKWWCKRIVAQGWQTEQGSHANPYDRLRKVVGCTTKGHKGPKKHVINKGNHGRQRTQKRQRKGTRGKSPKGRKASDGKREMFKSDGGTMINTRLVLGGKTTQPI